MPREISHACHPSSGRVAAYNPAMDNVILPADLEQFAAEAVATGRYRDVLGCRDRRR